MCPLPLITGVTYTLLLAGGEGLDESLGSKGLLEACGLGQAMGVREHEGTYHRELCSRSLFLGKPS